MTAILRIDTRVIRGESDLGQDDKNTYDKKWLASRYILEIEPMGVDVSSLDVESERERGVRNDLKIL